MTRLLKQSTAFTFRIGPFVDSTDGVTAETGLSIAQGDIQISKNGGAFAQTSASSPTTTHDADGWYQCPLTTTDTGTLGSLTVQVAMSGALPVWEHFMVVPANVYDSLVGGSDRLQVHADEITAGLITASAIASDAITAAKIANGAIDAATFAADVDAEILSYIVDDGTRIDASTLNTLSGHDPGETIMGATDLGTGSGLTSLATAANLATVDGVVDAIKAKTDNLPASPAASGDVPSAGSVAGAVWDEATSGHTTSGTFGKATADILADTNELQADDYPTTLAAIKAKTDNLPSDPADESEILAAINGLNDLSTSDMTTAVLAMAFEGSETFQDFLRLSRAVLYGLVSGMNTNAPVFVGADESTPRVSATTDADGNRTAVTLDPDS